MLVGSIWAESLDGSIGDGKDLLWHIPEDLKHFSEITKNSTVIMGKNTWLSLPEKMRPLKNRINVIVSSTLEAGEDYIVASSIEDALSNAHTENVWFIGGGAIYREAMDYVDTLEITVVDTNKSGVVKAPKIPEEFILESHSDWFTSKKEYDYKFLTYKK